MKGQEISLAKRLRVAFLFPSAFVLAAVAAFACLHGLGRLVGAGQLAAGVRLPLAGLILMSLAVVDLHAFRGRTYCPIGLRRQTPRHLMRLYPPDLVALIWGMDTGLAVTTFRVTAATWGAMALAFLGLAPWWIGLLYGAGFTLPLAWVLYRGEAARAAYASAPIDPGLERLAGMRPAAQLVSALLLAAGGLALLGSLYLRT